MWLDDELNSCEYNASRITAPIVEGARYMNDVVGSMLGMFNQTRNNQKTAEFRGGIWDCTPVKKDVVSKPSFIDATNNLSNKIFDLEEILANSYETENDSDMKENDDLLSKHNLPVEVKDNESCTEMFVDLKNKRWRSEECDKVTLIPCKDNAANRKKSKRNMTIYRPKRTGIARKYSKFDITEMEDETRYSRETVEESKLMKLVSKDVVDPPVIMEDNSVLVEKSNVKASPKVKSWITLSSQSSENLLHDEKKQAEALVPKKSLAKQKHRSYKIERNDWATEQGIIPKRSDVISKVKNDELINCSYFENAISELESKDKVVRSSPTKELKDELTQVTDALSNIRNIALEIKKTIQSSKQNSLLKNAPSRIDNDFSKDVESNSHEKKYVLKEKEARLRNVLLDIFDDDDIAESVKTEVLKIAEQKNKKIIASEKNKEISKSLLENKQVDFVPMINGYNKLDIEMHKKEQIPVCKLEDDSQYALQELVHCPIVYKNLSCEQPVFKCNEKNVKDNEIEVIAERIVSPTLYQDTNNINSSALGSRSNLCSNWRTQCVDVQQKDLNKNKTPQSSTSRNWRNESTNSASKISESNDYYSKKNRQGKISDKTDISSKMDYVYDDPMVVVPLNLSKPPDPLTRFKDVYDDPASIWDIPAEDAIQYHKNNQKQKDGSYSKTGSKVEDIHAQLLRKTNTSIPRFFDSPTKTIVNSNSMNKDFKHSSLKSNDSMSPVKVNENNISRYRSQQNVGYHRSYERNHSSSVYWRNPTYPIQDVYFIIKIKNHKDGVIEKLKILKEDFLEVRRENTKLADIIPHPAYQPKKIDYSVSAVKIFVRCVFSLSYQIPNWITALEAFSLGKKFRVEDLMKECEDYFRINKIPYEQVDQVAACAKQLQVVEALKSSKFFQKVQNLPDFSTQNIYTPQSCSVSCSVLAESSEFVIPLISEIYRGLESCNEADVKNSVFFRSLTGVISLTDIQLKFLTEDVNLCTELHIVCEVFQSKKKLFFDEFDKKVQSSVKISFEEEIHVKLSEEIEISVFIDSVLLKMCPQLTDNEFISPGQFRASFESSKTNNGNKLFCIEKLFYMSQV